MTDLKLHSFRRNEAASGATRSAGRLQNHLALVVTDLQGVPRLPAGQIKFLLHGPRDVSGLNPGAVRRTYPANGALDVETDKSPYAEFAAEDLPWRYSPDPNANDMRPWLLLLVGTPDQVALLSGSRAVLSQNLITSYLEAGVIAKARLWAHVQEHAGKWVSRLLSPVKLEASQSYVAVLAPAFDDNGVFSLPAGKPIPVYYTWRFTTSDHSGSFVDLARRLHPLTPRDRMGMAEVAYQTEPDRAVVHPGMVVGGALVGPGVAALPPLPPDVNNHFALIRPSADPALQHDDAGRPIVELPVYGEPWLAPGDDEPAWMQELNDDPRLRGVAGLGMWAAIEWQDRIVAAAAKQLGAFYTASRRVRQLNFGLAATRSLWDRRLPADELHRLQVLGLAMLRLATPQGNSVLDQVTATGRPMPPALFSSAARRLLRPGTAHFRLAGGGALTPGALFERMNTCPPDSADHPSGLPHVDILSGEPLDPVIGVRLGQSAEFGVNESVAEEAEVLHEKESERRAEAGVDDDDSWHHLVNELGTERNRMALLDMTVAPFPVRPCQDASHSPDLTKLSDALHEAFNPHGPGAFIIRRVLATIHGLDDQPLSPPELCLDFEIPAWKFLKEFAIDWFLPGLGQMHIDELDESGQRVPDPDKDPVIAAETNGIFSDAFLVGFNQQALAELRWKNVPVAAGCTPLRRFWEPLRPEPPAADGKAGEDIIGIHGWRIDTRLGAAQHETGEAQGDNLVLVFKSQLWRRYPETLVYLLPMRPDPNGDPDWNAPHLAPNLHVEIERDVVAFGFAQPASKLGTHWVVIEQVLRGINFYNLATQQGQLANGDGVQNSVAFARTAFAQPVRLLIRGTELQAQL